MLNSMSPMTVRLTVPELLKQKGMSTAEFAEKAKLTYNQALALKRGSYSRLDLVTLGRICEALGVQPGELFAAENQETK